MRDYLSQQQRFVWLQLSGGLALSSSLCALTNISSITHQQFFFVTAATADGTIGELSPDAVKGSCRREGIRVRKSGRGHLPPPSPPPFDWQTDGMVPHRDSHRSSLEPLPVIQTRVGASVSLPPLTLPVTSSINGAHMQEFAYQGSGQLPYTRLPTTETKKRRALSFVPPLPQDCADGSGCVPALGERGEYMNLFCLPLCRWVRHWLAASCLERHARTFSPWRASWTLEI